MSRYKDPFPDIDYKKSQEKAPSAEDKRKSDEADIWRFVGSIAPTLGAAAGTGIGALAGGPVGAGIGGTIGGGLGAVGGQAATSYGDSLTHDKEVEEDDRKSRRDELMAILASR